MSERQKTMVEELARSADELTGEEAEATQGGALYVAGGGVPGISLAGGGVPGVSLAGGGVPGISKDLSIYAGGGVPGEPAF